jgi:hypothetical protein
MKKRTFRRYAYRWDPHYINNIDNPERKTGLVFQSGPFVDKYFWTYNGLLKAVRKLRAEHPDAHVSLFQKSWANLIDPTLQ